MKRYYIHFFLLFLGLQSSFQSQAQNTDNLPFESSRFDYFCHLHDNDSIDYYHQKLVEKWQKKEDITTFST